MCGKGGTQTVTQQSNPDPQIKQAYLDLVDRATSVANTPYTPYTGQLVANLSPTQQQGISQLANAGQLQQPYIDQASQYAQGAVNTAAGAPNTGAFLNPYATQTAMYGFGQGNQIAGYGADQAAALQKLALDRHLPQAVSLYDISENQKETIRGYASNAANTIANYGTDQGQNVGNYATQAGADLSNLATQQGQNLADLAAAQGQGVQNYASGLAGGISRFGLPQAQALQLAAQRGQNQIADYGTGAASDINAYALQKAGAAPQFEQFSGQAVQNYQSPYTQQVIDRALGEMRHSDAMQQNDLLGRAISSGNAFGGDRAGLAAAELAKNQSQARDQTIANLLNQSYSQALGQFNTGNQQAQQAAQLGLSGLTSGSQLGLSAVNQGVQTGMQGQQAGAQLGLGALGQAAQTGLQGQQSGAQLATQGQQAGAQLGVSGAGQGAQLGLAGLGQGANLGLQAQQGGYGLGLQGSENAGALRMQGVTNAQQLAQQAAQLGVSGQQAGTQLGLAGLGAGQQGYAQAQQFGLGQQQLQTAAQAQGAAQMAGLGSQALQGGLTSGQAALAAGTVEQQQQQNQLNSAYQQFMNELSYPFQTTSYLGNVVQGTGALMGGYGSTTSPSASTASQVAGLGLGVGGLLGGLGSSGLLGGLGSGLLAFLKRGGRVDRRASGGLIPYATGRSYVPDVKMQPVRANLPAPPKPYEDTSAKDVQNSLTGLGKIAKDFKGQGTKIGDPLSITPMELGPDPVGETPAVVGETPAVGELGPIYAQGGLVPKYSAGGPFDEPPLLFADRADPVQRAIEDGTFDPAGANYSKFAPPPVQASIPLPAPRPAQAPQPRPSNDAGIVPAQSQNDAPPALAYDRSPPPVPQGGLAHREPNVFEKFADSPWMALAQAGFRMAASKNPNFAGALGEGALGGLDVLHAQRAARAKLDANPQLIDMGGKKIIRYADGRTIDLGPLTMTPYQQAQVSLQKETEKQGRYTYLGPSPDGQNSVFMDQKTGRTELRPIQIGAKPQSQKPLPTASVKDLTEKGESAYKAAEFAKTFADEYGGWKSSKIGDIANMTARNLGVGNKDAAEWWQNYARTRNVTRNKLFGSALTANETAEWEKADINPGMQPDAIRKNLKIQQDAALRAARKTATVYTKQGYDPGLIEAAIGMPISDLEGSGPAFSPNQKEESASGRKPSAEERFKQLRSEGLNKTEAYAKMKAEGY